MVSSSSELRIHRETYKRLSSAQRAELGFLENFWRNPGSKIFQELLKHSSASPEELEKDDIILGYLIPRNQRRIFPHIATLMHLEEPHNPNFINYHVPHGVIEHTHQNFDTPLAFMPLEERVVLLVTSLHPSKCTMTTPNLSPLSYRICPDFYK